MIEPTCSSPEFVWLASAATRSEASVAVTLYLAMADTGTANALFKSKTESDRARSKVSAAFQ